MIYMTICLPVAIVAALLAFFYGKSVRHEWLSALITFACALIGGIVYSGVGQIIGVVISAVIIFLFFTLPEQRRAAQEQAIREREAAHLPNEEDA